MAIIGVVGASGDGPEDLWKLAAEVGRAVVEAGHVLLTGGGGSEPRADRVRDCAVDSALDAGGKVISILPKGEKGPTTATHVCIETNMSSNARNVINGFTPDGLIALYGGGGTLSEVAYALYKEKAVVFLKSRRALFKSMNKLPSKLVAGYQTFTGLPPQAQLIE